jgi:hypothetical protein
MSIAMCECKYDVDMITAFERGLTDKECVSHVWCAHEHWDVCSECGVDMERIGK